MGLLTTEDLSSLLLFTVVTDEWVREVHRFTSQRKKKQCYVLFRNRDDRKLYSLEELKQELGNAAFLDFVEFKTAFSHDIVSNKVGANSKARKCAKCWMTKPQNVDECVLKAQQLASEVEANLEVPEVTEIKTAEGEVPKASVIENRVDIVEEEAVVIQETEADAKIEEVVITSDIVLDDAVKNTELGVEEAEVTVPVIEEVVSEIKESLVSEPSEELIDENKIEELVVEITKDEPIVEIEAEIAEIKNEEPLEEIVKEEPVPEIKEVEPTIESKTEGKIEEIEVEEPIVEIKEEEPVVETKTEEESVEIKKDEVTVPVIEEVVSEIKESLVSEPSEELIDENKIEELVVEITKDEPIVEIEAQIKKEQPVVEIVKEEPEAEVKKEEPSVETEAE